MSQEVQLYERKSGRAEDKLSELVVMISSDEEGMEEGREVGRKWMTMHWEEEEDGQWLRDALMAVLGLRTMERANELVTEDAS